MQLFYGCGKSRTALNKHTLLLIFWFSVQISQSRWSCTKMRQHILILTQFPGAILMRCGF